LEHRGLSHREHQRVRASLARLAGIADKIAQERSRVAVD
jgi:hypothetical protein